MIRETGAGRAVVAGFVTAVVLSSCGGDAKATGEAVIERQIAEQVGLGELEASCDQPDEATVGESFACSATTQSGETMKLTATFEEEDRILVVPTNVVMGEEMELVEAEAADVLGPEVGATIDPSAVECPDTSVVLDDEGRFTCTITDVDSGTTFELTATFGDFVRDGGFRDRFYEVGDPVD